MGSNKIGRKSEKRIYIEMSIVTTSERDQEHNYPVSWEKQGIKHGIKAPKHLAWKVACDSPSAIENKRTKVYLGAAT